ncbi:hypothetical protein ACFPRA_01425 [Sporosarcina soli]|uniref:Apea-like HEPN domain-containing protein n=1 Tax=Sporosarcina soli TaxID=334736 RepID=A0ABW0TEG7_9BACL
MEITYTAKSLFWLERAIIINNVSEKVDKITVESIGNTDMLRITLFLREVTEREEGLGISDDIVDKLISFLSFELKSPLDSVRFNQIKTDNKVEHNISSTMVGRFKVIEPINGSRIEELEKNFKVGSIISNLKIFYNQALKEEEPIGRFVLLYSLMYIVAKNPRKEYVSQFDIDKMIKRFERGVYTAPPPASSGKTCPYETIYTIIRNKIAHTEETEDFIALKSDVLKYLPAFMGVVKKCVESK